MFIHSHQTMQRSDPKIERQVQRETCKHTVLLSHFARESGGSHALATTKPLKVCYLELGEISCQALDGLSKFILQEPGILASTDSIVPSLQQHSEAFLVPVQTAASECSPRSGSERKAPWQTHPSRDLKAPHHLPWAKRSPFWSALQPSRCHRMLG